MESIETKALVRLAGRRFQSFSEATEAVLGALETVVPGALVLGQVDEDERTCRVLDAQGDPIEGVRPGLTLPLAGGGNGHVETTPGVDETFLRSLSIHSCLTAPLEMSNGSIAGQLCAFDTRSGVYRADHTALLAVGARLLSHEWESVHGRAELRRLKARLDAGPSTDPHTGLVGREAFFELLDREWRLSERGTVQSMLVVCRIGAETAEGAAGTPQLLLAVKDAAEVLNSTARTTDHVGRIGEDRLAAVLIGCQEEGAAAFLSRFQAAMGRVSRSRPVAVTLDCALQALAGTASAEVALATAERAVATRAAQAPAPERQAAG